MQEIIAFQKRDEAAQKQQELRKEVDKVPPGAQGHLSKGKGKEREKEKGITIREDAPRRSRQLFQKVFLSQKRMGRKKLESQSSLLLLLGNVLTRVVRLKWCLFSLQRFRLKDWLFILIHCLGL